LKGANTVDSYV